MAQKYAIAGITIPREKRKEINEKVLHIINTGDAGAISKEDIANAYTGEGGLHGLKYHDYHSYYAYSEAKKEIEQGQFFTPHELCRFIVNCINPLETDLVGDLTCGMGNFFNCLPVEKNVYGCELDIKAFKVARYLYPKAHLLNEDIRSYSPGVQLDIILGNPPFNLRWDLGGKEYLSQLYYCIKSFDSLKPAGFLVIVAPKSFLVDEFIDGGMIKDLNERFNYITQYALPTDSFKHIGVERFETKVLFFQKRSEHLPAVVPYSTSGDIISSLSYEESQRIYLTYIKPLQEQKETLKSKLFLEALNSESRDDEKFQFRVRKMLFDILRHRVTREDYTDSKEYVNRYLTQEKPKDMKWEEWEKVKITDKMVLAYLKKVIGKQNAPPEKDLIRLVKTDYGLKLKGYSEATRAAVQKLPGRDREMSFNEMVLEEDYSFVDQTYMPVYKRRLGSYKRQSPAFKDIQPDPVITRFLDEFNLAKESTGEVIRLNEKQKADLNLIFQKKYGFLCWQMGGGKTIGAICWHKYLYENTNIRNGIVVSSAISIYQTWASVLPDFKKDYIIIKRIRDLDRIKPRQIILITFEMLVKLQKHLKKFIMQHSNNFALVIDESDEMTNMLSKRSLSAINCFRRLKYKLWTTGTTTRNSINEMYAQMELLYNNSINMLCECSNIYETNKENEIEEYSNPFYMQPFPAYHGYKLFKQCFCPNRTTVFGVKKETQDIYNIDILEKLISKTIITRKFREIVGKDIYKINQVNARQNPYEAEVYRKIIEEFYDMMHYYHNTGNSRKESMLKLVRQLMLLIKSTSCPHLFKEYGNKEILPGKYYKVFQLVDRFKNEKIAIGGVFLPTVNDYCKHLRERFPERPLYLIKGGSVSFQKRTSIIKEFEASENGILVSTQQSLKCSVNIPTCNKVIVESMQWNLPKIEQYYFRFIRYNSIGFTDVFFVTYEDTIEQNLLALLMAKERLNDFIKTLDYRDREDLYNEFGLSLDILDQVMEKQIDDEGKVRITWGRQTFSSNEEVHPWEPNTDNQTTDIRATLFPEYIVDPDDIVEVEKEKPKCRKKSIPVSEKLISLFPIELLEGA